MVGGGLFGCYASLVLADRGEEVLLLEQSPDLLTRASYVNQARLHTGLHYPRSILTATEALSHHRAFRDRFPRAVRDFTQVYAVASHNSKTTGPDFASFVDRLGVSVEEVDPGRWFHPGTIARSFRVEEPSFDASVLRGELAQELAAHPNITLRLCTAVQGGLARTGEIRLDLSDGTSVDADGLVLATYAGTNALRDLLRLPRLPLTFELTEVILGEVEPRLSNLGFTVMDGPFWSLMPFGNTDQVTLTSVGLTPLRRAEHQPVFDCQSRRADCSPARLADCTTCAFRPPKATGHQVQQMAAFLKDASAFRPTSSLLTVKAVLTSTAIDDARPTLVRKEDDLNVWTVLSGKVSTVLDLERELG